MVPLVGHVNELAFVKEVIVKVADKLIKEAGVATVPGSCFACPGHIRISYCCADAQLEEGLNRLENFLKTL